MLVQLRSGHFINAQNIEQLLHSHSHADSAEKLVIKMMSGDVIDLPLDHAEVQEIKNAIDKALSK